MNQAWTHDTDLQEAAELEEGLYAVFGDQLADATPETVERMLARALVNATPAQTESIGRSLQDVGRWATSKEVRGVVGGALPIVGGMVGTVYGGPAGAAIGSQIGGFAGGAIAGNARPAARPHPAAHPTAAGRPQQQQQQQQQPSAGSVATHSAPPQPAAAAASPPTGSHSAAQLLQLMQNPALTASLLSLALGAGARTAVDVGGQEVPVGAFMNLLGTLAGRAADDADALYSDAEGVLPPYLEDGAGRCMCDPAVAAERADVLMRLLEGADDYEYGRW